MHIAFDETAHIDNDLRGHGQRGAEIGKHAFKDGNDENHDDGYDQNGDRHDDRRVCHSALDFRFQFLRFFDMGCQTLQNCIQDTANLSSRHQIHEKTVKHLGVLLK